jgi:signal transduction histidine kinase
LAMALAIGMVRLRRTRSAVVDVFSDLGHRPPPERLSAALARALGDPSLVVVTWSPASGGYVDGDGWMVELQDGTNGRAATLIERDGEPMAALVHDSALLEDPGLVNAIAAGVRLTIDNDQLQSELEQQIVEVAQSRTRIVEAGDAARRQIERDLHDGAQQRLVGLMLQIQLAKASLPSHADAGVNDMLDRAAIELGEAVKELRDLAHGIHPSVLTEFGLAAALESLARRSPIPISLDVALAREPEPMIATTAYFAIAEALTNAMKHARAESLSVTVGGNEQAIWIEITDDGIGGADLTGGTGVSAIVDRVATVGGAIRVASPPGGGTSIEIDLPCASS